MLLHSLWASGHYMSNLYICLVQTLTISFLWKHIDADALLPNTCLWLKVEVDGEIENKRPCRKSPQWRSLGHGNEWGKLSCRVIETRRPCYSNGLSICPYRFWLYEVDLWGFDVPEFCLMNQAWVSEQGKYYESAQKSWHNRLYWKRQ